MDVNNADLGTILDIEPDLDEIERQYIEGAQFKRRTRGYRNFTDKQFAKLEAEAKKYADVYEAGWKAALDVAYEELKDETSLTSPMPMQRYAKA